MDITTPSASGSAAVGTALPADARGVLAYVRGRRAAADQAEADLLQAAVQWALIHPAQTLDDAESYTQRSHTWGGEDTGLPLAGPGAPLLREFTVAEFATAVGMGTEAGKYYLGHALELRYRLPKLWAKVTSGELVAWKARRVAEQTIGHSLTLEAAAFVDTHVAPVAHKIRPAALERLVAEAMGRFMPQAVEDMRQRAADRRHFDIDTLQISFEGTALVTGELDLGDAMDLEDAVRGVAGQLKDLGSTESLDARRAAAVGEIARRQLALDLTTDHDHAQDEDDERGGGFEARGDVGRGASEARVSKPRTSTTRVRQTVLYLHLSTDALQAHSGVGRCENTRSPVTAETIREWCGHPDASVTVKPVIDLAEHVHVEAYEVPDRITEAVALRDHACVFPWCTRPARRLKPDGHRCDSDHITPYRNGGVTCSCQIAPLCRTHHRLKTHSPWSYTVLSPGAYLWSSPHGYQYLRDHTGTLDVSTDRRQPPPSAPPAPPPPRD